MKLFTIEGNVIEFEFDCRVEKLSQSLNEEIIVVGVYCNSLHISVYR